MSGLSAGSTVGVGVALVLPAALATLVQVLPPLAAAFSACMAFLTVRVHRSNLREQREARRLQHQIEMYATRVKGPAKEYLHGLADEWYPLLTGAVDELRRLAEAHAPVDAVTAVIDRLVDELRGVSYIASNLMLGGMESNPELLVEIEKARETLEDDVSRIITDFTYRQQPQNPQPKFALAFQAHVSSVLSAVERHDPGSRYFASAAAPALAPPKRRELPR